MIVDTASEHALLQLSSYSPPLDPPSVLFFHCLGFFFFFGQALDDISIIRTSDPLHKQTTNNHSLEVINKQLVTSASFWGETKIERWGGTIYDLQTNLHVPV